VSRPRFPFLVVFFPLNCLLFLITLNPSRPFPNAAARTNFTSCTSSIPLGCFALRLNLSTFYSRVYFSPPKAPSSVGLFLPNPHWFFRLSKQETSESSAERTFCSRFSLPIFNLDIPTPVPNLWKLICFIAFFFFPTASVFNCALAPPLISNSPE